MDQVELIILCRRNDIKYPKGGSSIRVAGYTMYLKQLGVEYKFFAPVKPFYVATDDYRYFSVKERYYFLIILHNWLMEFLFLKPLAWVIKKAVLASKCLDPLIEASENKVILVHQDAAIAVFIKRNYGRKYIYDVHGIMKIQKEYLDGSLLTDKIRFVLNCIQEKASFKYADYINAVSESMMQYIYSNFNTTARIFIAEDGYLTDCHPIGSTLPDCLNLKAMYGIKETDKVLFFAGSFKKFGGVHQLVDAFTSLAPKNKDLKLFLIGRGQMQGYITRRIEDCNLNGRFVYVEEIPYSELYAYQKLATIIVCPDISNLNNKMTPHIKVFDSVASGKPVIASRFGILEKIFPERLGFIKYFEPSNTDDLTNKIDWALSNYEWFCPISDEQVDSFSYKEQSKRLISNYTSHNVL